MPRRPSFTQAGPRSPLFTTETILQQVLPVWGARFDWPPTFLISTVVGANHELRFTSSGKDLSKKGKDHIVRYVRERVPENYHGIVNMRFKTSGGDAGGAEEEPAVKTLSEWEVTEEPYAKVEEEVVGGDDSSSDQGGGSVDDEQDGEKKEVRVEGGR